MLNPLQVDPTDLTGRAGLLDQLVGLVQDHRQLGLVLQTVHVLVAVGVTVLQHLDELLVQPLHGGEEAASDLVGRLVQLLVLLEDVLPGGDILALLVKQLVRL